jgi:hypothetical protein
MMMYDIQMHFNSFNTIISDGSGYISKNLNINTQKAIHIVCVYRAHSCSIFTFLNNLQTIIQHSPKHCPIIIMKNINVDILKNNNRAKNKQKRLNFINNFQLISQFSENLTKITSQLDRVWANLV